MSDPTGRALAHALEREFDAWPETKMTTRISKTVRVWDDKAQVMRDVTVDIKIDENALATMLASRVIRSKGGKATMHGEIIVAIERKRK